MKMRLWQAFEKSLGCDVRSLALVRVTISIVLLFDLINRFQYFTAFHSERGLFPRVALLELYGNPYLWSLNHVSTGDWWQLVLLISNLIFVTMLLFGWQTRLATVACWFLQLSLQAKNPLLMQSGDVLLRQILFWGMFLPWGARYSIDAGVSNSKNTGRVFTVATVGFCTQIFSVYFFGALLKTGEPWRVDGTAVYYALHLDHFSTSLGRALLNLPIEVLKGLNFMVLSFEFVGPILLLLPWGHRWLRPLTIGAFWVMHLSFGSALAIGNFLWISIAATMGFIPSEFWNWMNTKLPKLIGSQTSLRLQVYYDQDCGFCKKMVDVVAEFLLLPKSLFQPAQNDAAIEKIMLREDSWVVVKDGKIHLRSDALRELIRASPFRFITFLFYFPGVRPLGDWLYKKIASGRERSCEPSSFDRRAFGPTLSHIEKVLLTCVIAYVLIWNLGTLPRPITRLAQHNEAIGMLLRLDQRWDMFAPYPMTDDGWFVIDGRLRNGNRVDIFKNGASLSWSKPVSVKDTYKDFRWRKYMTNLWASTHSRYRLYYARYLCRSWNETHKFEEHVVSFNIIYMKEETPPPGQPVKEAVPVEIWEWKC